MPCYFPFNSGASIRTNCALEQTAEVTRAFILWEARGNFHLANLERTSEIFCFPEHGYSNVWFVLQPYAQHATDCGRINIIAVIN